MLPNIFLAAINSLSIDKSFRKNKSYITPIIFTLILLQLTITFLPVNATHTGVEMSDPIIFDEDYEIEKIIDGLNSPTTMSFLNNDLLVLEHFTGKVILVKDNGVKIFKPVLDLEIAYGPDYGLTGIETIENKVFLFFVPSAKDGYGVIKNSKNVDCNWFGLPILINKKFKNKKKKLIQTIEKLGIETRPIISGNFLNQPSIKLFKLNTKKHKLKNCQEIDERGFFIGINTRKSPIKKLKFVAKNLTLAFSKV